MDGTIHQTGLRNISKENSRPIKQPFRPYNKQQTRPHNLPAHKGKAHKNHNQTHNDLPSKPLHNRNSQKMHCLRWNLNLKKLKYCFQGVHPEEL